MRFLHISDLHIGRKLHGYSMVEDQEYILAQICEIARNESVDAVLVAGDVYDTSIPSEDAVTVLDHFLTEISGICPVYIAAGNHDSVDRLTFAREILRKQNVFITSRYSGKAERITVEDSEGPLNIYILPYTKTSIVRRWCRDNGLDDSAIETPDAAFSLTMQNSEIDPSARNILVAHEFVTGKGIALTRADSESKSLDSVGGADCISYALLEPFDYVALGHIHSPQKAGRDTVLYCGSPLCYSASEIGDKKHAVIVDVGVKGSVDIRFIPFVPLRDTVKLKGTLDEILAHKEYKDDYVFAALTAPAEKASERLSAMFRLGGVERLYDTGSESYEEVSASLKEIESLSPTDLFMRFFTEMKGKPLSDYQKKVLDKAVEEAGRGA